jgi:gluconate 5-dehydrogenase
MKTLKLFLSQKSALVSGGGRGIGKTIAWALAEAGANVVIASRDEQTCAETAREIANATARATVSGKPDVSEKGSVEEMVNMASEKLGTIDILVNNSGATWGMTFE